MKDYVRRGGVNLARGLGIALVVTYLLLATGTRLFADSKRVRPPVQPIAAQVQADCADNGSATVARHSATGNVRFAGAAAGQALRNTGGAATAEQAARSYLVACGAMFGLADAQSSLSVTRERTGSDGRSNVRYQQTYNGVPVLGAEVIVNLDANRNVTSVTGEVLPNISVDTQPRVEASAARSTALEQLAQHYGVDAAGLSATEPQLWIYSPKLLRPDNGPTQLVWRMEVTHADKLEIRALVLVNAHRGGVSLQFNQTDFARNRMTYSANNGTILPGTLKCNEADSACGGDLHAQKAHEYAADTYDFYMAKHGRDSIDGAGMTMISTVHYGNGISDAFWNGAQLIYGDGAGWPLADDIVAHEWTHAVTEYESGLFHYYQAGSIGESLSDLFGELVDLSNGAGDDSEAVRWKIGEDILGVGALRDMKDPTIFGHPDKMTSPNYYLVTCGNWTSDCDNGGVHRNSGVNNKAAYLLVDGDTFNGKTVSSIGLVKTAKIYYEAQTNLLSVASDYADLYNALYQACQNLIPSVTTAGDCQEVRDATDAVQMNGQPFAGYNPDAPICNSGSPSNVFFDDLEANDDNWTYGAVSGSSAWSYDGYLFLDFPHSGSHFLYGDDFFTNSNSFVAMNTSVVLPANAFLHFFHSYGFEDPNLDGGILEYSTNGGVSWTNAGALFTADGNGYDGALGAGNPLGGIQAWISDSHGYISSRVNLSSLAGQSVRFRWRLGAGPSTYDYGWFLDDVRIYTCGGVAGPVTVTKVRVTNKAGTTDITEAHRGDKVFHRVRLNNAGTLACSVSVHLVVKLKNGGVVHDVTKVKNVNPGNKTVKIKEKIADDAVFGTYKVKAKSSCNDQKSKGKDKFDVVP